MVAMFLEGRAPTKLSSLTCSDCVLLLKKLFWAGPGPTASRLFSPEVDLVFLAENPLVFAGQVGDAEKLLQQTGTRTRKGDISDTRLLLIYSQLSPPIIERIRLCRENRPWCAQCFCQSRCRPTCRSRPPPQSSETPACIVRCCPSIGLKGGKRSHVTN